LAESPSLDEIFSLAYEELRAIAANVRREDPRATLNPTALVNEAWLKLAASPAFRWTSPLHFKRIAARAMRQVLVDATRRRLAGKRNAIHLTLDAALPTPAGQSREVEFLKLDEALARLATLSPRQATIVESRFFGGMSVAEIASQLEISEATALRDWRAARAWLGAALREEL
jgi:RNA polymerase sigma-70 factor, ECF subfamily